MEQQSGSFYRSHTGYAPLDAIRFGQATQLEPHHNSDSDILLYRMIGSKQAKGMNEATRGNNEPDLLFLSRGAGVPAYGKVAGTPFKIEPNVDMRATFVPCDIDTTVTFGTSAFSSNLMFPRGYLSSLSAELAADNFRPLLFQDDVTLIKLYTMLEAEIMTPGFASRLMIDGLSRAIAAQLCRIDRHILNREADRIHLPPWKLRRLLDYIDSHLEYDITITELAELADLSVFHFSRVFRIATGTSPYRYVCDRRLQRSRMLLAESDIGIAELALICGFASQSHFTTAFSKAVGISPARFRRDRRN